MNFTLANRQPIINLPPIEPLIEIIHITLILIVTQRYSTIISVVSDFECILLLI